MPAAGSVVRCSTVKISTLATSSSGMETSSRRTMKRSIGCSQSQRPGGRATAARPPGHWLRLQVPVVHVEEAAVAGRGVVADRAGDAVVTPGKDQRLLEHRDPRDVLTLQLADLLEQVPPLRVVDGGVALPHERGGLLVAPGEAVLAAVAVRRPGSGSRWGRVLPPARTPRAGTRAWAAGPRRAASAGRS